MKRVLGLMLSFVLILGVCAFAADAKIDEIISKIRDNQNKIKDMSADVSTTIKSSKEKKSIEQKGKIEIKGNDKSRIEMTAPVKQTTIINKDQMVLINPQTGQKFVQDLSKLKKNSNVTDSGQGSLDQTKLLDKFNLSIEGKGLMQNTYIITGIPKEKNKFMGKLKFYIDSANNIPKKIEIYNNDGKLINASDLEYTNIKGIWVITKNSSWIDVPNGRMEILMRFDNVKINEGIPDKEFEVK